MFDQLTLNRIAHVIGGNVLVHKSVEHNVPPHLNMLIQSLLGLTDWGVAIAPFTVDSHDTVAMALRRIEGTHEALVPLVFVPADTMEIRDREGNLPAMEGPASMVLSETPSGIN